MTRRQRLLSIFCRWLGHRAENEFQTDGWAYCERCGYATDYNPDADFRRGYPVAQ